MKKAGLPDIRKSANYTDLGARTLQLMEAYGYDTTTLAKLSNVSYPAINFLIKGEKTNITFETLIRLADAFDLTICEYISEKTIKVRAKQEPVKRGPGRPSKLPDMPKAVKSSDSAEQRRFKAGLGGKKKIHLLDEEGINAMTALFSKRLQNKLNALEEEVKALKKRK